MKRLLVFLVLTLVAAHAVAMTASPHARPQAPQEMSRVVPAPDSAGVGPSADHP